MRVRNGSHQREFDLLLENDWQEKDFFGRPLSDIDLPRLRIYIATI